MIEFVKVIDHKMVHTVRTETQMHNMSITGPFAAEGGGLDALMRNDSQSALTQCFQKRVPL